MVQKKSMILTLFPEDVACSMFEDRVIKSDLDLPIFINFSFGTDFTPSSSKKTQQFGSNFVPNSRKIKSFVSIWDKLCSIL